MKPAGRLANRKFIASMLGEHTLSGADSSDRSQSCQVKTKLQMYRLFYLRDKGSIFAYSATIVHRCSSVVSLFAVEYGSCCRARNGHQSCSGSRDLNTAVVLLPSQSRLSDYTLAAFRWASLLSREPHIKMLCKVRRHDVPRLAFLEDFTDTFKTARN
jgi:hypothetical protein